jgi:hypothetical protein
MNEKLEKLLSMAGVLTTNNIEIRQNFVMYKDGDRGFYPLAKFDDKCLEILWLKLDDTEMDLYVRKDMYGNQDWLTKYHFAQYETDEDFRIEAKDLRKSIRNNYKMAKAVSMAREAFWNTYHEVMEGK